jgi:hypothetical protein
MGLRLGRAHLAVTPLWCFVALLSVVSADLIDVAASSDNPADTVGLPVPSSGAIDVRTQDASARVSLAVPAVPVVSDGPVAAPSVSRPPPWI